MSEQVPNETARAQVVANARAALDQAITVGPEYPDAYFFRGVLLSAIHAGYLGTAQVVAAVGLLVSAYLASVMIAKLGALCSTCINIAALNVLIAWQLVR